MRCRDKTKYYPLFKLCCLQPIRDCQLFKCTATELFWHFLQTKMWVREFTSAIITALLQILSFTKKISLQKKSRTLEDFVTGCEGL